MGGLLFGYDWVVIGGAKPFFEKYFELSQQRSERLGQQLRPAGMPAGSLLAGALSDRLGRKKLLLAAATLFAVSSVLTGWAPTFIWFVAWRITRRGGHRPGLEPFADVHRRGVARPISAAGWWRSTN